MATSTTLQLTQRYLITLTFEDYDIAFCRLTREIAAKTKWVEVE